MTIKKQLTILMIIIALLGGNIISCSDSNEVDDLTSELILSEADAQEEDIDGVLENNAGTHEEDDDYVWDENDVVSIIFNDNSVVENSENVTVDGTLVTIIAAGNYELSGSLTDGRLIVDTEGDETVRLILDGVSISSTTNAPLYIANAGKAIIILHEGSENYLYDAQEYIYENDEDEPKATIFSQDDLTIYGAGQLNITGNYNDAISGKDGLIINAANIKLESVDDGIRGKDYLIIRDTDLKIISGGDGLKSDNEDEEDRGYVLIESGKFNIVSDGDAISAESDLLVYGGSFSLIAGGGSTASIGDDSSAKGVKAVRSLVLENGDFLIDAADDALHANGNITIYDGTFELLTGDDAIHADSSLVLKAGAFDILDCYEGIESAVIKIDGGNFHITSSDDGLNVAGGVDGSGGQRGPQGGFGTVSGNYYLYINGGYIVINASGDGVDANGSVQMTGGTLIVHGPTVNNNSALDYDGSFILTGGMILAAGSSGMAQAPGTSSSQYSVLVNFTSIQPAGSPIHLQAEDGNTVFTFAPIKKYQSLAFTTPALTKGITYELYIGGSASGVNNDGLYTGEEYTPGTKYADITISDVVTKINSR